MKAFLEEVCEKVIEQYGHISGDICIITPNRRAGLFFRKYFSQKVSSPMWAPAIVSIEDFVNRLTGLQLCDHVSLMFEFYKVYKDIEGEEARSIDDFFRWAPVLLRDFDEVDAQLEDPSKLFGYLKDLKRIESWNPDGSPPTPFQQQYLEFFEKFELYHNRLKDHLLDRQLAWQGLSFRIAANNIRKEQISLPWKKIIFAGFNALNQSEETIIHSLVKQKLAEVITDSDPYYVEDPVHEAGLFIRRYRRKDGWNIGGEKPSAFSGEPKNIHILGIARNVNQARLAGNLMQQKPELTPDENTAIVMANENLLIPMLYALPQDIPAVNVTMGYPLKKTNLYGFFNALFQLHLTPNRLRKTSSGGAPLFYYKDVMRLFGHQATALLWDSLQGQEYANELLRKLITSNRSFCSFEHLEGFARDPELFRSRFGFLCQPWARQPALMTGSLLELCQALSNCFQEKARATGMNLQQSPWFLDYESLYYFSGILRRLELLMQQWHAIDSLKTFQMLFRLTVSETRIAFSGEPLEGLQIMGMLETRNLDFKNIILLSANEDLLPKGKSSSSFIPFDVKKKFGLQVHTEKDAIYAYHFYRLLQRARNIYMVYNTQKGTIGNQEKSRFITQLKMELPAFNPATRIREDIVALSPGKDNTDHTINIDKTPEILGRLQEMAARGFSPSALSSYINCPLQFYLQKVARLEEAGQVEETMEASTMGTVIHATLEALYKEYEGRVVDASCIREMKTRARGVLQLKFRDEFAGGTIDSGKNLLLSKVAQRMVENFLEREIHWLESNPEKVISILHLEKELEAPLEINTGGQPATVRIRGLADRIDQCGDTIRIIDYKSGKTEQSELNVSSQESIISDPDKSKTFQLLCYTWMYRQNSGNGHAIESGIFSMRNLGGGLLTVEPHPKSGLVKEQLTEGFEEQLRSLISNIMDPETPFTQAAEPRNCRYCPFGILCNRF